MNDAITRIAEKAASNSHIADTSVDVWAVRAAGISATLVMNPDEYSKEQILDTLEQLFTIAPTSLIVQTVAVAQQMATNPPVN